MKINGWIYSDKEYTSDLLCPKDTNLNEIKLLDMKEDNIPTEEKRELLSNWEKELSLSAEEWGDYLTWIINKRGYLFEHELGSNLGPEYSYSNYLKEKN